LKIPVLLRWLMALAILVLVTVAPVVRYRWVYRHEKRLREVNPGLVYRSGWMSATGFSEAIQRYGIRTVLNVMEDEPDPSLFESYFWGGQVSESALCQELGVRYVWLTPDLAPADAVGVERPAAIDHFLHILDDPANYPVLLHCRAGLHRTGVFTAIYRMEYQGWSPLRAWHELKENGFGEFNCYADNPYITQYLLTYQPGRRGVARLEDRGSRIEDRGSRIEHHVAGSE
jgi:hypothetical protein